MTISLRRPFPRVAALAAWLLMFSACTTWTVQNTAPPGELVHALQPLKVLVHLPKDQQVVVYRPSIESDQLVGWTDSRRRGPKASYPLSDVQSIETRVISGKNTAGLVVGVGVTALLIGVALGATAFARTVVQTVYVTRPASGSGSISCPLVYSFTDHGWQLDSGTFGGAIMRPAQTR